MAYAFTQDLPFSQDVHQRLVSALQDDPPKGLVVWVGEKMDEGIHLLQVWDSEEAYVRFATDRLSSIAQDGFFASTGYAPPEQEPPHEPITVLNVWTGSDLNNPRPGSGTLERS
jgi:hypothetical protein